MKNKENEKYVKLGITLGIVVLVGLAGYAILSGFGVIAGFLSTLLGILMPFVYGAIIAYLLSPLCNNIEALLRKAFPRSKGWPAPCSMVLSLLIAVLIIFLLFLGILPKLSTCILALIDALPAQLEAAEIWVHDILAANPDLQDTVDTILGNIDAAVTEWFEQDLSATVQSLLGSLSGTVAGLITGLKNIFLGILVSVYLLASRKKFAVQARQLLCGAFPKKWADLIEEEVHYADRMFNGFLRGRVIDSAIIGVLCFILSSLFGFDSAILVSVIIGVTNIVPVFGPFIGAIPCALFLLLENPMHCLIFLIFIVILQVLDGNVIGPRILGQTTGVSSFWVFFSVIVFGGLWGIVGMLIGVPLFAVLYDIVKRLIYRGLKAKNREDLLHPEDSKASTEGDSAAETGQR